MRRFRRFHRPAWLRLPAGPGSRTGGAVLAVVLIAGAFTATLGAGYSVSRPRLGDGSADLERGGTVVRVNGESGQTDAEVAKRLATGNEPLQTVRLPDGRIAVVNKQTGKVTIIDATTMTPTAELPRSPAGGVEPLATDSGGYLVDIRAGTVEQLTAPGRPAPAPVRLPEGVSAAVPAGDSAWILTRAGTVLEVAGGQVARTVRLGEPVTGLTVADGHPVAVTGSGRASTVDGQEPRSVGVLGLSGPGVVLGSWRGSGRYVLAVERGGRAAALDVRTGRTVSVRLPVPLDARLGAPVVLGADVYVPDHAGPVLWRFNAATGAIRPQPIEVPGREGEFTLMVSGGRVWANSQYDRRALIIDAHGGERRVDKGAASDVNDSQATPPPAPRPDPGRSGPPRPDDRTGGPELPGPGRPGPGRPGPDRTQPVPPKRVPSVVGLPRKEACVLIRKAKLICRTRTAPQPVIDPDRLGMVAEQHPAPGARPDNDEVTVTYPNMFAMPSVRDQMQGAACKELREKYKLTCRAVPGEARQPAGLVYQQTPLAGQVVAMGGQATLTYYSGPKAIGGYTGQHIDAACARVEADGFTCTRQKGRSPAGTGQQPGMVYEQAPPPGSRLAVGEAVTLTYYNDEGAPLGNYVGSSPDAACADINAKGYQCERVEQLYPTAGQVAVQDQQPGSAHPLGSRITVRYSRWQPVTYVIYRHNQYNVWALRKEGDPAPDGYGGPKSVVGRGYDWGTDIPSPQRIYGFYCIDSGSGCRGLPRNHLYTRSADPDLGAERPRWNGPTQAAFFMDCGLVAGTGAKQIYRVWKDHGGWPTSGRGYREEGITDNPAGWEASEPLGCVWP